MGSQMQRRRIDLKALVTEVRLSPWATNQELDEVDVWVETKNIPCTIHSDLKSPLTPTLDELREIGS